MRASFPRVRERGSVEAGMSADDESAPGPTELGPVQVLTDAEGVANEGAE